MSQPVDASRGPNKRKRVQTSETSPETALVRVSNMFDPLIKDDPEAPQPAGTGSSLPPWETHPAVSQGHGKRSDKRMQREIHAAYY